MTITAATAAADTLTPEDVHNVTFTPVRFRREGYDTTEVDNFLDRVENQLRTNDEYANELLKLLQGNGIMAPSRPETLEPATAAGDAQEAPEALEALEAQTPGGIVVTAAPTPIADPANTSLPAAA
jgi:DivIVA domain-containing protein